MGKKWKIVGMLLISLMLTGIAAPVAVPPFLAAQSNTSGENEETMPPLESVPPAETMLPLESLPPTGTLSPQGSIPPKESMSPRESLPPKGTMPPKGALPPASAKPAQYSSLALKNQGAKLFKGGQKGIKYGLVKNKKIYHIYCYATDEVKLKPTQKVTFKVTGGKSKKDVRSGKVKVTSDGRVVCRDRAKNAKQYAIIQMKSVRTKQTIFAYVYFAPRIYAKSPKKQVVYQGKTAVLSYNYPKKQIRFTSSNPKVARIDKKGVVTAKDKGKSVITAKVAGSVKNVVKVTVVVKEEPWLVNIKDTVYSYEDMTADLREIARKYGGKAALSSLGTSEDGRNIWCLRIGNPGAGKKIMIDACIHAREWMNCLMVMHKSEEILRRYAEYKSTLNHVCLYVVPMINPDGVAISQSGFGAIRSEKLRKICKKTKSPSRTWKGNARGVNLNYNFPGGWNRKNKPKKPDGVYYPGKKAASEKETQVMMRFVNAHTGFRGALNYHSMGSVLYWNYNVESNTALYQRQSALASKVNSFTGYRLMPKSISTDPNGGFGDWLIYNKKIPNVTVETGSVTCPLPYSQLAKIRKENSGLLDWFIGGGI